MSAAIGAARVPGACIGLVVGRDLAWNAGFGYADLAARRRVNVDTIFRIGSITKTFTGLAVVQLRDAGLISLDDPLVLHVPEFSAVDARAGPIENVTLRRLLTHRSGLVSEPPTQRWDERHVPSTAEILTTLNQAAIVIEPDSAFKYSSLGFALLGEVVARVSEMSFRDYVRTRILEPLGMASSGFETPGLRSSRAARGYASSQFEDNPHPARDAHLKVADASGQLYSTVNDIARWIALQFTGSDGDPSASPVVSVRSLAEIHRPAAFDDPSWRSAFCLAWAARREGDVVFHGHDGAIDGFSASVMLSLAHNVGAVALTNGSCAAGTVTHLALTVAIPLLLRTTDAENGPLRPMPTPAAWKAMLGEYATSDGWPARVECRGGGLVLSTRSADGTSSPIPLVETDEDDAFVLASGRGVGETLRFTRNEEGAVTAFFIFGYRFAKLIEAA
jgi:CubicO group peptidase (beta-lactamase class C family)